MKSLISFYLFAIIIAFTISSFCFAQQEPEAKDESKADGFENMQQFMGPMMGQMMQTMMTSMFEVLSQKNNAEKLAEFTKNYYDALIDKGFSKEDALKIVISIGIPSIPSLQ